MSKQKFLARVSMAVFFSSKLLLPRAVKAASTPEEDSSLYDPSRLMAAAWQTSGKEDGCRWTTPDLARRGQEDNSTQAAGGAPL